MFGNISWLFLLTHYSKRFLAGENTSVLIILATTVCIETVRKESNKGRAAYYNYNFLYDWWAVSLRQQWWFSFNIISKCVCSSTDAYTALWPKTGHTLLPQTHVNSRCMCALTLQSCWPWDNSSNGNRWLHLVQAYRADVAITKPTNTHLSYRYWSNINTLNAQATFNMR